VICLNCIQNDGITAYADAQLPYEDLCQPYAFPSGCKVDQSETAAQLQHLLQDHMHSLLERESQHRHTIRVSQTDHYNPIMSNAANAQNVHADGDPQARHTGDTIDLG